MYHQCKLFATSSESNYYAGDPEAQDLEDQANS